jgi:hypothetical protein
MARKFLYFVAFLVVLAVAGAVALRYWSREFAEIAYVPSAKFEPQRPLAGNAYDDPKMWFARPGVGKGDAAYLPEGFDPQAAGETGPLDVAVFFVHPTSYLERAKWNAALDDAESQARARLFIRGMASPFGAAREIWIPRYRQATFGAFLTDDPQAGKAIDAAYADVAKAFDYFIESVPKDTPIVLAGHSQGSLHLLRLLKEKVAGTPLAERIVAAYPIGWPVSVEHDLPALGLPACATAGQPGCLMSWSSFAEPAEPGEVSGAYSASPGFDGQPRGDSEILCSNPLTGGIGGEAPASANMGTLVPTADLTAGKLVPGLVPARCDKGLLLIGPPPELGPYVLPGNNYHVYDIPLFWANLRADVAARVAAWRAKN